METNRTPPTRRLVLLVAAALAAGTVFAGSSGFTDTLAADGRRLTINEFMTGLACVESKGSFSATNRRSGAIGKYQIMPRNWVAWSGRYLRNRWAKPTPRNQEFVARERVAALYELHGSWRLVAKWWRTGNAERDESTWTDGSRRYVDRAIRWATLGANQRTRAQVPEGCFPIEFEEPTIRSAPRPRVLVSGGRVYVRRDPGYESAAFQTVKRGTRLTVLSRAADPRGKPWVKVGLPDGQTGWLAAWFTKPAR